MVLYHLLLPCLFPGSAYFLLYCQFMCECESLLMRVSSVCLLRALSFCVCVVPPEEAENSFSLHLRSDNNCLLWLESNQFQRCLMFPMFVLGFLMDFEYPFSAFSSGDLWLFAFIVLCSLACFNHTFNMAWSKKAPSQDVIKINIFKKGQAYNRRRGIYKQTHTLWIITNRSCPDSMSF